VRGIRRVSILDHVLALMAETDLRYQQRFDAQGQALTAALLAAEKAVQCCTVNTPVLCADLTWRPAGDLAEGDELIAFDEGDPGTPRGRRFRRAVVTGNRPKRTDLVRVVTVRGEIQCNAPHPFLSRLPGERWRWVRAEDLRPGDQVMYACDVWEHDRSWEAGWLAGMFDGEGCLSFTNAANGRARLSIVQRESETAELIGQALKERCDTVGVRRRPPTATRQPRVEYEINRRADIMRILGSVRPQRLLVNSAQVWNDFPLSGNERAATVLRVEPAGRGMVASLSTSTGTYIAAGFAVHNTALIAAEKAVAKAETANEKRFESVNEFRKTLSDQTASFPSRVELQALADRVSDLATRMDKTEGKSSGLNAGWAYLIAAAGIVVAVIALVVR
jgi:hypothetical protein